MAQDIPPPFPWDATPAPPKLPFRSRGGKFPRRSSRASPPDKLEPPHIPREWILSRADLRLESYESPDFPQENPVPVPVVPPESPASHLSEPELRITEPPPNLAGSPHVHGIPLPVVEQTPGKLSDDGERKPIDARTPDMMGSSKAVPLGFETECVISRPALLLILNPHSVNLDPSSLSQHAQIHRRAPRMPAMVGLYRATR